MQHILWMLLALACSEAKEVYYHTYYQRPLTNDEIIQQAKENTTFWCSIVIKQPCDPNEGRRLDGTCNNLKHPAMGGEHTPFMRVLPPDFGEGYGEKLAQSGQPKTPVREVRTTLLLDGIRPDKTLTHLATHFIVFSAADTTSIQDTIYYILWKTICCLPEGKNDKLCTPIEVSNEDPVHRFSSVRCFNMTRPLTYQYTGCTKNGPPERISSAMTLFDLSMVYGSSLQNALTRGRLYQRGQLKYELDEKGRVWPPSYRTFPNVCYLNQMPYESRCHQTPDDGMNSLLGINLGGIWFWRNHNRIASALADLNPGWDDDKLFYTARDINIASYSQILYYEFLPLLLGWDNLRRDTVISDDPGFRDEYDPNVLPQVSLEFPYILRWAHLMQETRVKMYNAAGQYLKQISLVNLTLRTGYMGVDNNIDYITQGSFRQASAKLDYAIDPNMGERVLGPFQFASDVGSSDLKKGRTSNFPPYVDYVKYFTGKTIDDFDDLEEFIDADKLDLIKDLYEDVRDIDLMAGNWVEKPIDGGLAPSTFYFLTVDQYIRSKVSDRHWYERPNRPNAFTLEQLLEIRKSTISRLLCDVGDSVTKIQRRGFERVGPKNKMVSCSKIPGINLSAWKDPAACSAKRA